MNFLSKGQYFKLRILLSLLASRVASGLVASPSLWSRVQDRVAKQVMA